MSAIVFEAAFFDSKLSQIAINILGFGPNFGEPK